MKDQPSPTTEENPHRSQPSHDEHWLERAVSEAIEYVGSFLQTFLVLLWRPNQAAQLATDHSARPRGFLVGSLLVSGLMIQTVLLYRGRSLDGNVLSLCSRAIESWGLRELFLLTIPPLVVVWLAAQLTAWLANMDRRRTTTTVFDGFCHSVGVQLLIVALAATAFIGLKAMQSDSAEDHRWTRDIVLIPVLIAIVLSGTSQLQVLLAAWGQANWAQRWWLRLPFATLLSVGLILGVLRIAAETFDFKNSKQVGDRLSMEQWSGRARILVDVLESRPRVASTGGIAAEGMHVDQRVALTNVTDLPHAIACPTELRLLGEHAPGLVSVLCRSNDGGPQSGWVLQPGETRIVAWTLTVPSEVLSNEMSIAAFSCVEIDLERWHREIERPLGPPMDCLVNLRPADWTPATNRLASQPSSITNLNN
ncbi:MAG: hypothetical protein NXI32_22270 [bacterium]|nr:hypothetical protein [bacterium]